MAPRSDLITALGWEFLESVPPFYQNDPDVRAVLHCYAKEAERVEERLEWVRAQMSPATADDAGLRFFEWMLRLPTDPAASIAARREAALRRLAALDGDPSGRNWIERLTRRLGGVPWTYEEHDPDDAGSPPPQVLRIHLPFDVGTANWDNAILAVEEETPAELGLNYVSSGGFIFDRSQMDVEGMGI